MVRDHSQGRDPTGVGVCGGNQVVVGRDQKGSVRHHPQAIEMRSSARKPRWKEKRRERVVSEYGGIKAGVCSKGDHMKLK